MKKTVSASVGRMPFTFEEDAYAALNAYLKSIEKHFASLPGGTEVTEDLERRVAELLLQQVPSGRVVASEDVAQVVKLLGSVEDITGGPLTTESGKDRPYRRLYRDVDNRVLGGVCSGLGAYFGVDAVWIRLAWLALFLFFGSGLLLYLIFWIVMPPARTALQKLEMHGQPVDLRHLSRKLMEEVEETLTAPQTRSLQQRVGEFLKDVSERLFQVMATLFRAIGVFASIVILLVTFALLLALGQMVAGEVTLISLGERGLEFGSLKDALLWIFPSAWQGWLTAVALVLLVSIPVVALALRALRFLFRLPQSRHWLVYPFAAVWLVALGFLLWSGVRLARDFSSSASQEESYKWLSEDGSVHVNMKTPELQGGLVVRDVQIHIFRNTTDSLFKITLQKNARGPSRTYAQAAAASLDYGFSIEGSRLQLPSAIVLAPSSLYRGQHVEIFLFLPTGARLTMDQETTRHLAHVPNLQEMDDEDMALHSWEMTPRGLSCTDCRKETKKDLQ